VSDSDAASSAQAVGSASGPAVGGDAPGGVVFLKLGGALVTDKRGREAARKDVIGRLADEIAAWRSDSQLQLVLGHGSGSFAHVAAEETAFLDHPGDPLRLARVAAAARRLNTMVVDALLARDVPAVTIPGGVLAVCRDGRVERVRTDLVVHALRAGLLPVTYGDAAPDAVRGGTIASTEPLLAALARDLHPVRIVLATDVDGVFPADPNVTPGLTPIPRIDATRDVTGVVRAGAREGASDVTGGMATKIALMIELARARPDTSIRVLSGLREGALPAALRGDAAAGGTVIAAG
jgi:isopentenyl phosphate kinase